MGKLCVGGRVYVYAMLSVSLSFHTLWEDARLLIDSVGVPTLIISLAFYMFWQHSRVQIDSTGLPTLKVCQGTDGLDWIALVERFYCVSHALEACKGITHTDCFYFALQGLETYQGTA